MREADYKRCRYGNIKATKTTKYCLCVIPCALFALLLSTRPITHNK